MGPWEVKAGGTKNKGNTRGKDRGEAGKSVDGHALFLVGVEYPYLKQD